MFGGRIRAAMSVKRLSEDLYSMEYTGDYGFDKFLDSGGADTDEKMADQLRLYPMGFIKIRKKNQSVETMDAVHCMLMTEMIIICSEEIMTGIIAKR